MTGPFTFVLTLSAPYNPAEQELSIIRPLRFLSPASFITDAPTDNSCPPNRRTGNRNLTSGNSWVFCREIKSPMGTGPYKFVVRGAFRVGVPPTPPPHPPKLAALSPTATPFPSTHPSVEQDHDAWPHYDARKRQHHPAAAG